MSDQDLPNRLRQYRRESDLSQDDLAKALGVGNASTISRWETGKAPIPDEVKLRAARYFAISVVYLMRWEDGA